MKKIILFICLLLFSFNINAESVWSEIKINDESKTLIREEIRYRFYKEVVSSSYKIYDEKYSNSYNLDDFIYSKFTVYKEEKPVNKPYREIEEEFKSKIFDTRIYNIVMIDNINIMEDIKINEIIIRNKITKEEIKYEILLDNELIKDNKIILNLNEIYNILESEIIIKYKSNNIVTFNISFGHSKDLITAKKEIVLNPGNSNEILDLENLELFPSHLVTMYRYRDKFFRFDKKRIEYKEGYYVNLDGYIKDEKSSKTFYLYEDTLPINDIALTIGNKDEKIDTYNNRLAYNTIRKKNNYNVYLTFGSIFIIIGTVLLTIYYFIKKRTKNVV